MTNTPYPFAMNDQFETDEPAPQIAAAPSDNVVSMTGEPIAPPIVDKPKRKYTRRKPLSARKRKKQSSAAAGASTQTAPLSQGIEPPAGENPTASPEVVGSHLYRLQKNQMLDPEARFQASQFRAPLVRPEYDTPRPSWWRRMVAPFLNADGGDGRNFRSAAAVSGVPVSDWLNYLPLALVLAVIAAFGLAFGFLK